MAEIDPKKLLPGEDYVLMAILDQRDKSKADVFVYDFESGQTLLRSLNASKRYGIGPDEQLEIIQRLAKIGFINADWALWMDGGYVFENKYDWALDKFSMEIFEEEVLGIKPKPICIIKLSYKEMGEIYNSAIERYDAQLSFDGTRGRFIVTCEDGKRYSVLGPNDGSRQFDIITYIMKDKNIGRIITKDELREQGIGIGDNEYIESQVFRNSDSIKKVLFPFFTLKTDSIRVERTVKLTLAQLDAIKSASI